MLQLTLSEKTIETQRKVVMEEYKQRYLNQPYGDIWHHMRDLAYKKHPYRWPTIGQDLKDIQSYRKDDVWEFYQSHYSPDNAILVVGGDVTKSQIESLTEKWFAPIKPSQETRPEIIQEPDQKDKRIKTVEAKVPTDALYIAYKMPGKNEPGYAAADLTSDLLGFGKSSILEQKLVKKGKLFASIGAFVLGSVDPGLLVFSGKMESGVSSEEAEEALNQEIKLFVGQKISEDSLQKIKNQGEAMKSYESIQLLNRVFNLAYYAHLGNPDLYMEEFENKSKMNAEELFSWAKKNLIDEKSSVLHYKSIPS
jgi:predicted Zn-dependent peptidase